MPQFPFALGFSTGAIGSGDPTAGAAALLDAPGELLLHAAEISALRQAELPAAIEALETLAALDFYEVRFSLHAPKDLPEARLAETVERLAALQVPVVVHADVLARQNLWGELGSQLLVENLDARAGAAAAPESLVALLQNHPQARLCLDLAHCAQCDPSLLQAHELLDALSGRLGQLHLSGAQGEGGHTRLPGAPGPAWTELLCRLSGLAAGLEEPLPVILESPVAVAEMAEEWGRAQALLLAAGGGRA